MGEVVGSVNYSGTFLGKQVQSSKQVTVGQALQANGATQSFASRDEALAAIDKLPMSDTDYAVMKRPDGRFEVRAIEQDYAPEQAASAHLDSAAPTAHPSIPGDPVAIVFRGTVNAETNKVFRSQVITSSGVESQSAVTAGNLTDAPPPAAGTPEAEVFGKLSGFEQANFLQLSPADRRKFADVYLAATPNTRQAISLLLADGKCAARGSDGKTVMDHLRTLQTQPLAVPKGKNEKEYREGLVAELSRHIAFPNSYISQRNRGTCAATCCQMEFVARKPADYARFVVGLTSASGEAKLPNGETIRRVPDSLNATGDDKRTTLNRLTQSAIMNYSTGTYSAASDSHKATIPVVGTVDAGGGLAHEDAGAFLAAIRGGDVGVIQTPGYSFDFASGITGEGLLASDPPTIMNAVADDIQAQKKAGANPPMVPTGIEWGGADSSHEVMVTEVTADRVFFRNPHGNKWSQVENDEFGIPRKIEKDAQGREYIEAPDPGGGPSPMRFYRDGSQSMAKQDFTKRLQGACLTKGTADRYKAHESKQMSETFTSVLG